MFQCFCFLNRQFINLLITQVKLEGCVLACDNCEGHILFAAYPIGALGKECYVNGCYANKLKLQLKFNKRKFKSQKLAMLKR